MIFIHRKMLILLLLTFAVGCPVMADHALTQDPETQGLNTLTTVEVAGLATENDEIVWQMSSQDLTDPTLSLPILSFPTAHGVVIWNIPGLTTTAGGTGETQYTVSYSDDTIADQGNINYAKQTSLDTSNKPSNQENLETEKVVVFGSAGTGRMTSSEDLLVDGASEFERTVGLFICPFASGGQSVVPPYCNVVEMGSSVDLTDGRLHTSSGERTVAATADVPVEAGYSIELTGIDESPASGSADAYMQSRLMEGMMQFVHGIYGPGGFSVEQYNEGKTLDMTYSEETTASGEIYYFRKDMEYQSGVRRIS